MKVFIFSLLMAVVAAGDYNNQYDYKDNSYAPKEYRTPSYAPSKGYGDGYNKEYYAPQPYHFGYKVKDDYTYTDFSQYEEGDGYGKVSGTYRVLLPDYRTQVVHYKDEGYGYVADVTYEGEAKYPEYNSGYNKDNNYKAVDYSGSYNKKQNYGMSYETPSYKKEAYPPSHPY